MKNKNSQQLKCIDEILKALNCIDEESLVSSAKSDSSLKLLLDLVKACKKLCKPAKCRKASWLQVARALYKKLHDYDNCINLTDSKRTDSTWCMWLRWDGTNEIGMHSAYSLCSENLLENKTHEEAAKSFIENFCKEMPKCADLHEHAMRSTQRQANYAIATLYNSLHPTSPEDLAAKLGLEMK